MQQKQQMDAEIKEKNRFKELEKVNLQDLLMKNGVQIKIMKQQLDRLIPSDDSHTVLMQGKETSIEVIPNTLMTFRMPCRGAKSPARVVVKFNMQQQNLAEKQNLENGAGLVKEKRLMKASRSHKSIVAPDLNIYVS